MGTVGRAPAEAEAAAAALEEPPADRGRPPTTAPVQVPGAGRAGGGGRWPPGGEGGVAEAAGRAGPAVDSLGGSPSPMSWVVRNLEGLWASPKSASPSGSPKLLSLQPTPTTAPGSTGPGPGGRGGEGGAAAAEIEALVAMLDSGNGDARRYAVSRLRAAAQRDRDAAARMTELGALVKLVDLKKQQPPGTDFGAEVTFCIDVIMHWMMEELPQYERGLGKELWGSLLVE